jgi:hypothetical protein
VDRLTDERAQTLEAVGELRNLEVKRLDSLQLAMWQKAMQGDVPSAAAVVRVIMSRCPLLGLEGSGQLRTGEPRGPGHWWFRRATD